MGAASSRRHALSARHIGHRSDFRRSPSRADSAAALGSARPRRANRRRRHHGHGRARRCCRGPTDRNPVTPRSAGASALGVPVRTLAMPQPVARVGTTGRRRQAARRLGAGGRAAHGREQHDREIERSQRPSTWPGGASRSCAPAPAAPHRATPWSPLRYCCVQLTDVHDHPVPRRAASMSEGTHHLQGSGR